MLRLMKSQLTGNRKHYNDPNPEKIVMNNFQHDPSLATSVVVKSGKAEEETTPSTWKEALLDFTQNTTLHGIRFIFMSNTFCIRRIAWLLLFLLCSVLMSLQIIERIVYFYSYPVTVNVHVNYNKTLAFPAITLCNQNAFRATAATDTELYRLLEAMYTGDGLTNLSILEKYNAQNMTIEDVYQLTSHSKYDLITACKWQEEICGPENFTEILTDHGVCFTFNYNTDDPLWVTSTGSDYGLQLTLNVEQYEYMPGPHNAAGIKMLLHDQREFPKVAELGLAIPTGSHTFVGIQLLRIENLPEPHGSCRTKTSPYYVKYSPDACHLACTSELLKERCHCRHFYMPNVNGTPSVCTLDDYFNCYLKNIASVKEKVLRECKCPVPCDFLIYDPTISFASTSVYATDKLLATTGTEALEKKYLHARETTAKMDVNKFDKLKNLQDHMKDKFDRVYDVLYQIVDKMTEQKHDLHTQFLMMKSVWESKKHLLEWQAFHVKKNFMRARNAMEERTLSFLALGFQEYSYQVEIRIKQIAGVGRSYPEDVRTALFLDVMNMLKGRMDLADRGFQNYTQLYGAYANGTAIFRYKFMDEPREQNYYITPRPLLNHSLYHNNIAQRMCGRIGETIMSFKDTLNEYLRLANISYTTGQYDPHEIHQANVVFLYTGRVFNMRKSNFYQDCIEYPYNFLLGKIDEFDRKWRVFENDFYSVYNKVEYLLDECDDMQHSILSRISQAVSFANDFIIYGNVSKLHIAEILTSDDIYGGISELKNFFSDIRTRGQNVYDGWTTLIAPSREIWEMVLEDENMEEYYTHNNMTEFLRNDSDIYGEIVRNYTELRDHGDFRHLLGNSDSLFLFSLDKVMEHMANYIDNNKLDERFINKNFLRLDVFYREKSYEQITQQKAYDMFALLCDIGGSMGLFVGASVLTIYELLDFGVHHAAYTLFGNRRKK